MTQTICDNGLCTTEELADSLRRFARWLDQHGYASYDPYDLWGTAYGRLARRLYYAKHPLGKPLVAPVILGEILCPSLRGLFVKKDRFATADAQVLLAFLNLHRLAQSKGEKENPWLARAESLAEDLLRMSIPGYSGHCWGYPFDWQNVNGLMPKGTPHVTATPYCYEAFAQLFDLTGKPGYRDIARSTANFVCHDLQDTPTGDNAAASSYSPTDCGKVVNASAYRAYILFDAARRFDLPAYREKAVRNLNFILASQREDGSWLYAIENPREAFIDHFHTSFVLKNLYKLNLHLNDPRIRKAIESGYAYYRRDLFDSRGLPKAFAIEPRKQISRLELYNFAEAITLCVHLRDLVPGAWEFAQALASFARNELQLPAGTFITRFYRGGLKHRLPYMRWAQAQMFLALTSLLEASSNQSQLPVHREIHEEKLVPRN